MKSRHTLQPPHADPASPRFKKAFRLFLPYGRARRLEYAIFLCLFLAFNYVLYQAFLLTASPELDLRHDLLLLRVVLSGLLLAHILSVVLFFCATARRLHDFNQNGWWALLSVLPVVGQVYMFVLIVIEGTAGENKYGKNPKHRSAPMRKEP